MRVALGAVALLLAMALSGCSGDGDGELAPDFVLDRDVLELSPGETKQVQLVPAPGSHLTDPGFVSWYMPAGVALVATDGSTATVMGLAPGRSALEARWNAGSAIVPVHVAGPALVRLVIEPANPTINVGANQTFQAFAVNEEGNRTDVTEQVAWFERTTLLAAPLVQPDVGGQYAVGARLGPLSASTELRVCTTERHALDQRNDVATVQVRVIYVTFENGTDRHLDSNRTIATTLELGNDWLAQQSRDDVKGLARMRYDRCNGRIDVRHAVLPAGTSIDPEVLKLALHQGGNVRSDDLVLAFMEADSGSSVCGKALVANRWAFVYLNPGQDATQCPGTLEEDGGLPGFYRFVALHELFHSLGAVATCAPNHVDGHVPDANDLMASQSGGEVVLDVGRDDYWGHNNGGCNDIQDSVFLDWTPPVDDI